MERDVSPDFQSLADRVLQYHSHIVSLISGIVIGMITNYLIIYVFPIPYWYGLALCIVLLVLSTYVFSLYSPQIIRGNAVETVPKTLHKFLHHNFDKLLTYIQLDLEGFTFHKRVVSYNGFMAPVKGVQVKTSQISSHQGDVNLEYPFFGPFKCKIALRIFVTSLRSKLTKVIINVEINRLARLHPKSDQVLRTAGIRVRHAILNPQLVNPEISDEEYEQILKDIRPYILKEQS